VSQVNYYALMLMLTKITFCNTP